MRSQQNALSLGDSLTMLDRAWPLPWSLRDLLSDRLGRLAASRQAEVKAVRQLQASSARAQTRPAESESLIIGIGIGNLLCSALKFSPALTERILGREDP